ncbi:MAG: hypothetical protein ACOY3P_16200 [Planctomycetota bacterium]
MRVWMGLLVTMATVAALPQLAAAADENVGGRSGPSMLLERLDKNDDGVIDASEVPEGTPEAIKGMLKRADKDGDKRITKEELAGVAEDLRRGREGSRGPNGLRGPAGDRGPGGGRGPFGRPGGFGPPSREGQGPDRDQGPSPRLRGFGDRDDRDGDRRGPPADVGPRADRGPRDEGGPDRDRGGPRAEGRGPTPTPRPDAVPDPKEVFKRLDTDGNGQLSPEEFAAGAQRLHEIHVRVMQHRLADRPPFARERGRGPQPDGRRGRPDLDRRPDFGPRQGSTLRNFDFRGPGGPGMGPWGARHGWQGRGGFGAGGGPWGPPSMDRFRAGGRHPGFGPPGMGSRGWQQPHVRGPWGGSPRGPEAWRPGRDGGRGPSDARQRGTFERRWPGRADAAQRGRMMADIGEQWFARADQNKDGKIALSEIPENRREGFKKILAKLDKDNDEALSKEEAKAGAQAMAGERHGRDRDRDRDDRAERSPRGRGRPDDAARARPDKPDAEIAKSKDREEEADENAKPSAGKDAE